MATTSERGSGSVVEYGDLAEDLRRCEFPVTTGELLARFGPREIGLAAGRVRFSDVLIHVGPGTFDSLEALERAVCRESETVQRTLADDAV